jgi:hypothetical protein
LSNLHRLVDSFSWGKFGDLGDCGGVALVPGLTFVSFQDIIVNYRGHTEYGVQLLLLLLLGDVQCRSDDL